MPTSFALRVRRIYGLILRIIFLHLGSWPRLIEVLYWPTINMLIWGFTSFYMIREIGHASIVIGVLIGGVLLSEVLVRVTMGMLILFLEEIWSRNLGHLFASPLRVQDYIAGLFTMSFLRMTIAMSVAVIVASYMFGFSLFSLGAPLVSYVALLVMNGWWYGLLLVAMLIRYGLSTEWLAWMSTWLTIPLIAPYYPVSVLPHALQIMAHMLPATYVFESMKAQVAGQGMQVNELLIAFGLNILYAIGAGFVFRTAYRSARDRGSLLQMGE
jgi:ABC-2 type transport system permease protein